MPTYPNTPGITVARTDGGLRASQTFQYKPTLVLVTAAQGPAGAAIQVTDPAATAALFGLSGTASRAMAEVLMHSDNVQLFRFGSTPAILSQVGKDTNDAGFSIQLGQQQLNAGSIYQIWYAQGVLYLWLNGSLVYAEDAVNGIYTDSGDSIVSGSAVAGQNLCVNSGSAFINTHAMTVGQIVAPTTYNGLAFQVTVAGTTGAQEPTWDAVLGTTTVSGTVTFKAILPSVPSTATALTVSAAAAIVPSGQLTAPILTQAVDGTGLTARQTYVALADALYLLSTQQVAQVYCPNVVLDTPNVAFYVAGDSTTALNNPATNANALDWLKITTDVYGDRTYTWATDAAATFTSPQDRLNQGYSEVNFGYLLANFAALQEEELGGCVAFIGTNGPAYYNSVTNNRFDLLSTRRWIGNKPSYGLNGNPTSYGVGLCGIPYLVGTTASKLNPLTFDFAQGYRSPGFFENDTETYDGGANEDPNGNQIDIGQYLHVVADYQQLQNSYSAAYIGNLAGVVAGKAATLDQSLALTYKVLNGVTLVWSPNFPQMDILSFAKLNVCRGDESIATLLHDNTAALSTSDWYSLYNVQLRFLLSNIAYTRGKTFLGTNALNGLQAAALQTGLDSDASVLQTRGYISTCTWTISTTLADARIGQAAVGCQFSAPGQLRQLNFSIGITNKVTTS